MKEIQCSLLLLLCVFFNELFLLFFFINLKYLSSVFMDIFSYAGNDLTFRGSKIEVLNFFILFFFFYICYLCNISIFHFF